VLKEDILVFADSDQLILAEPEEFNLKGNTQVALQKVAQKGIGTNGKDENADYWHSLYKLLEVEQIEYFNTLQGERIYKYFNSGLVISKRNTGLFQQWKINFELIFKKGLQPKDSLFFVEQSVLSATLSSMQLNIKNLPFGYNHHLFLNDNINETLQLIEENKVTTLHYHKYFDQAFKVDGFNESASSTKVKWISESLLHPCRLAYFMKGPMNDAFKA
jgi:hypothetical protein